MQQLLLSCLCRDQVVLPLDGNTLAGSPAGKYTLLVTVTNALSSYASATATFTIVEAGSKPSIVVYSPGNDVSGVVAIQPSNGLKLYSKLQLDSVCKGSANKVRSTLWCS